MVHSAFIAGRWSAGGGPLFRSVDPATEETVWTGESATPETVRTAFAAARSAFAEWALTSYEVRRTIVKAYGEIVNAKTDDLAELISRETGKPFWETRGEVGAMVSKVGVSTQAHDERAGRKVIGTDFGEQVLDHKPLGIMIVLGPYNLPGHLPNGHIIPALLAGNAIVFKPSELCPAVGEFMVQCWEKAGLPKGVLNLIQGGRKTGAAALDDPDLDGVLFTGSWKTGVSIHRKFAGRTGVQLALEMGGNNPLVIWDVADAEAAARIAVLSSYITAGQRCSCARRLILPHGEAGDVVVELIADMIPRLTIGTWNTDPFMGPLVSRQAAVNVLKSQDELISLGARPIIKSTGMSLGDAFISPGLLDVDGVNTPDEEIFGPMIQVRRAETFEAALKEANNTAYGLSAGLVSDSEYLWKQFWAGSRAGIVNRNRPTPGAASTMPFGGPGQSGNLRPSAYYAADYVAYPVATQSAKLVEKLPVKGL